MNSQDSSFSNEKIKQAEAKIDELRLAYKEKEQIFIDYLNEDCLNELPENTEYNISFQDWCGTTMRITFCNKKYFWSDILYIELTLNKDDSFCFEYNHGSGGRNGGEILPENCLEVFSKVLMGASKIITDCKKGSSIYLNLIKANSKFRADIAEYYKIIEEEKNSNTKNKNEDLLKPWLEIFQVANEKTINDLKNQALSKDGDIKSIYYMTYKANLNNGFLKLKYNKLEPYLTSNNSLRFKLNGQAIKASVVSELFNGLVVYQEKLVNEFNNPFNMYVNETKNIKMTDIEELIEYLES